MQKKKKHRKRCSRDYCVASQPPRVPYLGRGNAYPTAPGNKTKTFAGHQRITQTELPHQSSALRCVPAATSLPRPPQHVPGRHRQQDKALCWTPKDQTAVVPPTSTTPQSRALRTTPSAAEICHTRMSLKGLDYSYWYIYQVVAFPDA